MKNTVYVMSIFILCALLVFPVKATAPGGDQYKDLSMTAGTSPLWQRLFVDRRNFEKYPAAILGQAVDVKEPFGPQIQRAIQTLTTTQKYWVPGTSEPASTDNVIEVSFKCGVTRQHWPVSTGYTDSCGSAVMKSDWLTDDGIILFTSILNHYWSRSPRVHQQLISLSTFERTEETLPLQTNIQIVATFSFSFEELKRWGAYFFSHHMITQRKLKESPELLNKLEVYYNYGDVPELIGQ